MFIRFIRALKPSLHLNIIASHYLFNHRCNLNGDFKIAVLVSIENLKNGNLLPFAVSY